jgi:hypothetical protein
MNPLDIYKKLPRLNCGECPDGTCLAFAVMLSKKERDVSECLKITEQSKKEIEEILAGVEVVDWKDKMVDELFDEIARKNFSEIAQGLGAVDEGKTLKIRYLGSDVRVSHTDVEDDISIWDTLLLLIYMKNSGNKTLSGNWVAFRDLMDGSVKAIGFKEECEVPLAQIFDADREGFVEKLHSLGAKRVTGFSTKLSYEIFPLPKVPFLVLLWPGDEDFDTSCNVLLDATATDFLDVETLTFLGQALIRRLKLHRSF